MGISAPAIRGPATAPNDCTVEFSAFAAGSSRRGTSRAIAAERVGWLTPKNACCSASRSRMTHTDRLPANDCAASSAEVTAIPAVDRSRSRRRSIASAIAPPQRPKTTSGTSATPPLRPTIAEDPVRS